MGTSTESGILLSQAYVAEHSEGWNRSAFRELESRLGDPEFPCVFARNAFRKESVKFIFVESSDASGIRRLVEGLKGYVELSRRWDGRLDTAYPLVVAFAHAAVDAQTVDNYHAFGWRILQCVHESDPSPWPEGVAKDPGSEAWSMCFNGMPIFCNMSCPAHRVRRSRNLGAHFMIIINPRERFDHFAGDTLSGRKVRSNIRDRIDRYDGSPHSSDLGSYGGDSLEWLQYGLPEGDVERTGRCPFKFQGIRPYPMESDSIARKASV